MYSKTDFYIMHSAHLDLYWMGSQETCLEWGAGIIDDAVEIAGREPDFRFLIETVRFLEYYLDKHPEKREKLKRLVLEGRFEVAGDYTDRLENQHDGESLLRNVLYGKKILRELLGVDTEICYHPDIPGFAEQMPQLYEKSGVPYCLSARGFKTGARFFWKGLDKSRVIMYNFPQHYAYYSIEEDILPFLEEIKRTIGSEDIVLSCSAGDLGPANTFSTRENGKWKMVRLTEFVKELNSKYPQLHFKIANVANTLKGMEILGLKELSGENPPRWGLTSALEVGLLQMDKKVSAELLQAEKYSAVCDLLDMSADVSFPKHPLKHNGYSGGTRKYFDLKFQPSGVKEYLDFGWRLQTVTQDHNYSGVDGAQSRFDRYRYKKVALRIANEIKRSSLEKISSRIASDGYSVVVFNAMNWKRTGEVYFESDKLDGEKVYKALDSENNAHPVVKSGKGYCLLASGVPSFGYKSFRIEEGTAKVSFYREVNENCSSIVLRNIFYELAINKQTGAVEYLRDLDAGENLVKSPDFLTITAFEDHSVCVNENSAEKPVVDESKKNVWKVSVKEDNCIRTIVEIVSEICNVKVKIDVILKHYKKEIGFNPVIYWCGQPDVQLKLNLNLNSDFTSTYYGVPYGAQKLGNYLESSEIYKEDEIIEELYQRYREVQQWFTVVSGKAGICIGSNVSAFDFNKTDISAMLLRDVRNCGEHDARHSNEGELSYEFLLTSYAGSFESSSAYRRGWELVNPLEMLEWDAEASDQNRDLPPEASFIDTGEAGILTVFKKSDYEEGKYIARVFNTTSLQFPLKFSNSLNLRLTGTCDFNENIIDDPSDRLEPFEIKAVKFVSK